VLESLKFSAELRLPITVSAVQKQNFVEEQLEILELVDIQHSLCAGLSMEQNKRLTLGVELVSNPSIVFADEPTSSLDARAAAIVMRVLTKIAHSGRTVICTIHQPSAEVFLAFDDLLLLKRGGEIVYFGELGDKARNLINYFQSAPGTPPCPPNSNPGTWMLEILGAGTTGAGQAVDEDGNRVDFAAFYKRSSLKKENDVVLAQTISNPSRRALAGLSTPAIAKMKEFEKTIHQRFVRGYFVQLKMLLQRDLQAYLRTGSFTVARYAVVAMITLLFSLIFYQQKITNVADIQSRVVLLYFFCTILSCTTCTQLSHLQCLASRCSTENGPLVCIQLSRM
jgi:energy-coupling factor transporter ATP-binding protein EcfA2